MHLTHGKFQLKIQLITVNKSYVIHSCNSWSKPYEIAIVLFCFIEG